MRKTFRNKNNKIYWHDRWANIATDVPMSNKNIYPLKYSNLVIKNKNQKILEAGCGAGRILKYYHKKDYNIIGIDFIKLAIQKIKKQDPTLRVKNEDILNLSFRNNYFDVILAFGLFHNFFGRKLTKSIKESHRVLKKGGSLCASFRADNIQQYLIDFFSKNKTNNIKKFHKLNLKKKEFRELIENSGFEVKNIYNVQNMPFLYKFSFFREKNKKIFDEKKSRSKGYKLSFFGNIIQKFLIKFFSDSFCNSFIIIAIKK